ncbi:MAG TPA: hypothetical protein VL096_18430, partial [Pirellulaceae bacterium]|nr:hypothetical protein [Pirellulaceae bacterium]
IDELQQTREIGPIVRGVYIGHQEARNRVLSLMLQGQGFGVEAAVVLNRLRHRIERWSDLLLGYVHTGCDAKEFAFDPVRMAEFADDIQHEQQQPGGPLAWQILLTSLRAAFVKSLPCEPVNADLHERICASILSCFEPDLFDSTGVFKSLWMVRMSNVAKDTQGMIDSLLAEHHPSTHRFLPQQRFM